MYMYMHVHVFEVFIIKLIIKEGICTLYYPFTDTSVMQFIELHYTYYCIALHCNN